ncbi:MAG: hypothetical protein ACE5JM_05000, partial [Armatimonadota bacterium]
MRAEKNPYASDTSAAMTTNLRSRTSHIAPHLHDAGGVASRSSGTIRRHGADLRCGPDRPA